MLREVRMLAAASPERERFPPLFQLALQVLSARGELPAQLAQHLETVIVQALEIAGDPQKVSPSTLPEAIQLALEIRGNDQLRAAIEPSRTAYMTVDAAKSILALERNLAAPR